MSNAKEEVICIDCGEKFNRYFDYQLARRGKDSPRCPKCKKIRDKELAKINYQKSAKKKLAQRKNRPFWIL